VIGPPPEPAAPPRDLNLELCRAAHTGETEETLLRLIAAGASVARTCQLKGFRDATPLHLAARAGNAKAAEVLLSAGAGVTAKDGGGATALHWAVEGGHHLVVKVLLDAGADVAAKDSTGQSPLRRAVDGGHDKVAKVLLDAGAAPETPGRVRVRIRVVRRALR